MYVQKKLRIFKNMIFILFVIQYIIKSKYATFKKEDCDVTLDSG